MFNDSFWGTTNLKDAAISAAGGAVPRQYDPITCTVDETGRRQYTFWFSGGGEEAHAQMQLPWNAMTCDAESWIRYARAAMENRETLLGLMKRAEPIVVIKRGGQTLLVAERARPEIKRDLLKQL
ncbi:hypothetical protein EBS57_08525 [bacterium]|nr:hypothetical protein [bacterium]